MTPLRKFLLNIMCMFVPKSYIRSRIKDGVVFHGGLFKYLFAHFKVWRASRNDYKKKYKYFLSVVCIIKNEAPYMKEWLDFHIKAGVEKFYMYDNESTDDIKRVFAPYIKSGIVEYKYWPGNAMQNPAYRDCIANHKNDTKWLALIDADEFITPVKNGDFRKYLKSLPNDVSQVTLHWNNFGSNGHKKMPTGGIIKNYLMRAKDTMYNGKAIINPRKCVVVKTHFHSVLGKTLDGDGNIVPDRHCDKSVFKTLNENFVINHYWCKSHEEFEKRWTKGDADLGHGRTEVNWTEYNRRDCNEVYDDVALKFIKGKK